MRRRVTPWLPAFGMVAGAAVAGFVFLGGDDDESEPLSVESSAATFDSLDELVTASEVVVVATVTDIADGRTITAPHDPDAGIRTRLVELDVSDVLRGDPPDRLVVEEAASFRDGAPIVLDGMTQLTPGDQAVWFLVAGGSEEMPYLAVVNGQGRYELVGATLRPANRDPLSAAVAELGLDELAAAVAAA